MILMTLGRREEGERRGERRGKGGGKRRREEEEKEGSVRVPWVALEGFPWVHGVHTGCTPVL